MAQVRGPLLSLGASGSIAKTQVYSKWKGRPYVRQLVIPANPKTASQSATRNPFKWLQSAWPFAPEQLQEAYKAYASGKVLTDRNAWGKLNISGLRGVTDPMTHVFTENHTLEPLVFSPGARGGYGAADVVATPGVGQLSIAVTPPDLPTGWTIVQSVVVIIKDQDPQSDSDYTFQVDTQDNPGPYTSVFAGLDTDLYRVGAWLKYTRPDGLLAYGRSEQTSGTPT